MDAEGSGRTPLHHNNSSLPSSPVRSRPQSSLLPSRPLSTFYFHRPFGRNVHEASNTFCSTKAFAVLGVYDPPSSENDKSNTEAKSPVEAMELSSPVTTKTSQSWSNDKNVHPPQDSGSAAWIFLLGACIVEAVSWGMLFSGVPFSVL